MCKKMSGTLPSPYSPEKSNESSDTHLQEFNEVTQVLKLIYDKYSRYKILYDAAQEITSNGNILESELNSKIENIVFEHRCRQVSDLKCESLSEDSNNFLGLPLNSEDKLNYNESVKLKEALKLTLHNKYKTVCDEFYNITGTKISNISTTNNGELVVNSDNPLIELKKKLEEQQKKYFNNLLEEQRILEDNLKLRLEKLPEVCINKVKECEVESLMSELRANLVKEKIRVGIFTGTSKSLMAYKELISDIKNQQQECQAEIQYLRKLKEKYNNISCKQFEELLKTYNQYKSSLAKMKMIYDSLQG